MNWRAFLAIVSSLAMALSIMSGVTVVGSRPSLSMISPRVSGSSLSSVNLPFSFGSIRSSTEVISLPTFSGS